MARFGGQATVIGAGMGGRLAARAFQPTRSPDEYGRTIARVSRLIYGFDSDGLHARAMTCRDARGCRIEDGDWARIEEMLRLSHAALRAAIDRGPDGMR